MHHPMTPYVQRGNSVSLLQTCTKCLLFMESWECWQWMGQGLFSETDPILPKTGQATSQVGRNVMSSRPTVIEIVIANPQQNYSCHVRFPKGNLWELDYKESWAPKNWCFWTVVLDKTLESPLDCKEIQPVHSKGNESWVFIGRTDGEAETPNILATWCEDLTHLKRPCCWESLKAGGEGDDRGWDG